MLASVSKTKCAVTCEEHNRIGGLGDSIAQLLSSKMPSPLEYVAVNDSFGESGKAAQLLDKYGLGKADIISAVRRAIARK